MNTSEATLRVAADRTVARPISPIFLVGLHRLFDMAAIAIVGVVAYFLIVYPVSDAFRSGYLSTIVVAVAVAGILAQWFGVYSDDLVFSKRLGVDRILSAWASTFCVLLTVAFALGITGSFSRLWTINWFAATTGVLVLGRLALSYRLLSLAREGRFAERTIVVGAGEQGQRLAEHLMRQGDIRTRLIGFIDDRKTRVPVESHGVSVLGNTEHLVQLIRQGMVDQVFLALPWNAEHRVRDLVHRLAMTPVHIRLAPDLAGFEFTGRAFTQVAGLPMLHVLDRPISGWSQISKSIEDRVLAALALLFVGPLLCLIALAIKFDSPGPVFFKQNRYGFNNNLIKVWKFRTMYTHLTDRDCEIQTTRNDPRVTRIGDFLRRSSLDELPQLFNVLRGEMSIVGPRPHAAATKAAGRLFEDVVDTYAARHKVKPGITGWAQVNGWRGQTDTVEKLQKRVEYDLYYIDNWSIWFDLLIVMQTFVVLFRDENAY